MADPEPGQAAPDPTPRTDDLTCALPGNIVRPEPAAERGLPEVVRTQCLAGACFCGLDMSPSPPQAEVIIGVIAILRAHLR